MIIEGHKKNILVYKNIIALLLTLSPFFFLATLSTLSGTLTPISVLLISVVLIPLISVIYNEIAGYRKASDTIKINLNEGLVFENNNRNKTFCRGLIFVGFGQGTKDYRVLIKKIDGSEYFMGRYYLFDKSLKDINQKSKHIDNFEIKTLNGFQFFNKKIFGA